MFRVVDGRFGFICQIPVSYSIWPIRPDERDQGTSFDGSVLQSSGAVLSNEESTCPWRITELGREGLNLTDVTSYMASLYLIHFNGAPNFDEAQSSARIHCTVSVNSTVWSGFVEDADFAVTLRL